MTVSWKAFKDSWFLYRFLRDPVAMGCALVLFFLCAVALLAPVAAPHDVYDAINIDVLDARTPPAWTAEGSSNFLLGTDQQGRDLLSAMIYGMRTSLIIGLGATMLQCLIGVVLGLTAGYAGGKTDAFLMRMADVQLSFSTLMVAIIISVLVDVLLGRHSLALREQMAVPILVLVIGLAEWPQVARTVRASVLAEKRKEYVEAARVIGLSPLRIMFRHILPNTLSPVLVIATVQVAGAIMSEAALSFLGLGMPVTRPSLGSLIKTGFEYIFSGAWWITAFPGVLLVVLILVINLLGDWLRDFLNPKLYKKG
ncbi:Dipeptide transport system permease protein DppC [Fundidesulfovibrio magnetotacticus]|uniref:Dipeptide transport system permease protein DppC n=1 Tax=Fundidesulfovibrio magnetotacticus TaxID=2730080 RepID=A0A6V8LSE6_9BACT|nr:ABC transporter permease [Fundidesulfovibrio magnetotacticus]GFK93228.1 Dipeptide transport system permease protein DppC [Fundidesulfovibrio magnetotacticus]